MTGAGTDSDGVAVSTCRVLCRLGSRRLRLARRSGRGGYLAIAQGPVTVDILESSKQLVQPALQLGQIGFKRRRGLLTPVVPVSRLVYQNYRRSL